MPDPDRIVITGYAAISPLGNDVQQLMEALAEGRSGVRPLKSIPTDALPMDFGGECTEFTGAIDNFGDLDKPLGRSIRKGLKVMCREIQMAVASAQRAMAHAGLTLGGYDPDRAGVVYGSDYIMTRPEEFTESMQKCIGDGKFQFDRWADAGIPEIPPLWLLKYLPNMPASHIAIYNDMRGPSNSITLRESSSNVSLAEAFHTIRRGAADLILAGATGTRIHPLRTLHVVLQEELASGNGVPESACRPFERNRRGMVVGEGAAALVVESLSRAEQRGATIRGEILSHGASTVVDRAGRPDCEHALRNAIKRALEQAQLTPAEIGHVNAHGIATSLDVPEAQAIRAVLGDAADRIPVAAAKSYFGNLGAGGGAVELIASLLAFENDRLFPTLNYEEPDPDCPVRVNTDPAHSPGNVVLKLSVTPQGQASALLVRRWE